MKTIHTARVISMGGRNGRVRSDNGHIKLPLSAFGTLSRNRREGTSLNNYLVAYSAALY